MTHRHRRLAFWMMILATGAVPVLLGAMLLSYTKPLGGSVAGVGFASVNGYAAIALSDNPLTYAPPIQAMGPWSVWTILGGGISMAPTSRCLPSRSVASVSFVPVAGRCVTATARIYWIPTWWFAILATGVALLCLWRTRWYPAAGGCDACGYSRRGLLPGALCPECGAPALEPLPASCG